MSAPDGQSDDTLVPGTTLGRYEIGRLLGRGGMGAVYEAVHRDLKKRVAIKVLSAKLASEEAKQRFLREGEAASRIQHPNVVDVTDVGVEGGLSYLVMEFLEGEDLSSRLAREGSLAPRQAADILLPVCAGLGIAHDEGVVHRDLKPENIFLVKQRQGGIEPKVLDFGISKLTGRNALAMTGTIATFGTPYYMPPEQVRGARQADQRSDVYALGVVLYECVTGRRPFEADNVYTMLHAIGAGEYLAPRKVRPELPLELEAVIVRAMRLEPADRFPTVRHLAAALLPFASDKSRVLWADTFGGSENSLPDTVPPHGKTSLLPPGDNPGSVSGTRLLPSSPELAPVGGRSSSRGTTLGSATGQHFETIKPPRSRFASSSTSISRPVSISPQVEALTNKFSDWPRWLAQSAGPIFSAIRASRVASSGVRNRASARHIRASPSRVPSENSCRKVSTTPCRRPPSRAPRTRASASARTSARSLAFKGILAIRSATASVSSRYLPSSSASQSIGNSSSLSNQAPF